MKMCFGSPLNTILQRKSESHIIPLLDGLLKDVCTRFVQDEVLIVDCKYFFYTTGVVMWARWS